MTLERLAAVMYYCAPRRTWERNGTSPRGMDVWLSQLAGWRTDWRARFNPARPGGA